MRGGRGRGGFYPEICLKNSQFLAREMSVSGCDIWRRIHVAGDVIDAPPGEPGCRRIEDSVRAFKHGIVLPTNFRLPSQRVQCRSRQSTSYHDLPYLSTAHRPVSAPTGQAPAGLSLSLLRQTDAGHPATHQANGGKTTRNRNGPGDGHVSHAARQDGAPPSATPALGRKTG